MRFRRGWSGGGPSPRPSPKGRGRRICRWRVGSEVGPANHPRRPSNVDRWAASSASLARSCSTTSAGARERKLSLPSLERQLASCFSTSASDFRSLAFSASLSIRPSSGEDDLRVPQDDHRAVGGPLGVLGDGQALGVGEGLDEMLAFLEQSGCSTTRDDRGIDLGGFGDVTLGPKISKDGNNTLPFFNCLDGLEVRISFGFWPLRDANTILRLNRIQNIAIGIALPVLLCCRIVRRQSNSSGRNKRERLPNLFCHERHDRMEQSTNAVESSCKNALRQRSRDWIAKSLLGKLHIPITKGCTK